MQEQLGYGGSIAGLKMFKFLVRCCVFERQKPLINGRVVFAPNGQRAASRAALRRADVLWKGKARVTVPYLTSTCTRVAVLLRLVHEVSLYDETLSGSAQHTDRLVVAE